ncbi:MAG: 1-acyl-sn-glycerol-3-phosphate acyltransferase [Candidatus Schekmanbacteria bacterium]|nr:1-acyl-sn-glycerol-3-phosphate acyltransferase [Candidatus Schekmanbacteria bacterium]
MRAVFVATAVVLLTIVHGLSVIVLGLLGARARPHAYRVARAWARAIVRLSGIALTVEGGENVASGTCYMVVANHRSLLDIPVLMAGMPMPLRFATKKALFAIPIFGQGIRALGMVPIDRHNSTRAMSSIREAVRHRIAGASFLFFPEGTRSRTDQLLPFKRGAAVTAIEADLDVLPVAILGTEHVLPADTMRLRPGPVRLRIGYPIGADSVAFAGREELTLETRRAIQELLMPALVGADS